jgi:hypothetical protein
MQIGATNRLGKPSSFFSRLDTPAMLPANPRREK